MPLSCSRDSVLGGIAVTNRLADPPVMSAKNANPKTRVEVPTIIRAEGRTGKQRLVGRRLAFSRHSVQASYDGQELGAVVCALTVARTARARSKLGLDIHCGLT
jgi:hypothetical protein